MVNPETYNMSDIDDYIEVMYSEIIDREGVDVKAVSSAMIENEDTYISSGQFEITDEDDLNKSDLKSLRIYDEIINYSNNVFDDYFSQLGFDIAYKKGSVSERNKDDLKDIVETEEENYVTITIKVYPAYLGAEIKQ